MVSGKASNKYCNLHIIKFIHGLRHYVASYPPAIYFYKDMATTLLKRKLRSSDILVV